MGVNRWRGLLGPPSLVISTALVVAAVVPAALAAGPLRLPPAPKQPCPTPGLLAEGALPAARESNPASRLTQETLLTSAGEETGRRLVVGSATQDPAVISLPPESFVAGPYGDLVLYGWHTPAHGSQVRAVAMTSGCDARLARPAGIVRSAVLDQSGTALYVHAVTEGERRDAGVVRHDLPTGASMRVVEPLPASDAYGPTFATSLVWRTDGAELAVQSCGASQCRTRILDVASGTVQTYDGTPHGELIGFDAAALYAFEACHWAPCDVLAIERSGGGSRVVVHDAYDARLVYDGSATRLSIETLEGIREVRP